MRRALQHFALALASCACVAVQAAQGEAHTPGPAAKASRELVEQKVALVKRMLSDSPAAQRIEASSSAQARQFLSGARDSYRKAARSIQKSDYAGADRHLNEATWLVGKARQLVPDPLTRNIEHRVRYAQMLDSVESLRISYQRHLQRLQGKPAGAAAGDARLAKATQLIDAAMRLANSEELAQANRALADAEQTLMAGLSRVLGAKTIEYAQRFETPAEEYAYELERNRSYEDLIPIALAAFRPGSDAIREVQYFLDGNRKLREQAQQHAARNDYRAGLSALRGGTAQLQSALAAAGLRVPQEAKAQ